MTIATILLRSISGIADGFYQLLNSVRMSPYMTARHVHVISRVEDIKQRDATRFSGSCVSDIDQLRVAVQAIRDGKHPPLIILHGQTGVGKSVLAAEMLRNGDGVSYLDATDVIGGDSRKRAELRMCLARGAKVFIIDETMYLRPGMHLRMFYLRCKMEGAILVLVVHDPRDLGSLRFDVPPGAVYYTPDRTWMRKRAAG